MEDHEQGTLQKDLVIAPCVAQLKTITLRKSNWLVFTVVFTLVFTVICWNIWFLFIFFQ